MQPCLHPWKKKKKSARLSLAVHMVVSRYRALQSQSPSPLGRYWSLWSPPTPPTPTSIVQHSGSGQLCFHFRQRVEKEEEEGGRWKTENTVRENRGPLVRVQVLNPPRPFYLFGSVLVLLCVRRHHLTNMCPARQISPDSEGLQTNMSTCNLDIFLRPIPSPFLRLRSSHPPPRPLSLLLQLLPTVSFQRSWWFFCRAVGIQYFHDASQNPSGTRYPVYQLSALWKTTTIQSRGRSSELITVCWGHSPRLKSFPLLCRRVFRKRGLLAANFLLYPLVWPTYFYIMPCTDGSQQLLLKLPWWSAIALNPRKKGTGGMWCYISIPSLLYK